MNQRAANHSWTYPNTFNDIIHWENTFKKNTLFFVSSQIYQAVSGIPQS